MKRTVIISGGNIESDFALAFLKKYNYEYLIGADRGIVFLRQANIMPTHIVGDFDSAGKEELAYFQREGQIPIEIFPPEKDWTDTQLALELALNLGSEEIYILGAMGRRVDHLLANVRILTEGCNRGVPCYLLDQWNRIRVTKESIVLPKEEAFGTYLSLFALGDAVTGLTLEGTKYGLRDYTMTGEDSIGVSNEITKDTARISFESGLLVVAESRDHTETDKK
jgi:thiamine pyrophosphokinase